MKDGGGGVAVESAGDLQPRSAPRVGRAGTWRIECAGVLDRRCPGRVWWYHAGRLGRPVERCPRCRVEHERERKRENRENSEWKRLRLAELAGG